MDRRRNASQLGEEEKKKREEDIELQKYLPSLTSLAPVTEKDKHTLTHTCSYRCVLT